MVEGLFLLFPYHVYALPAKGARAIVADVKAFLAILQVAEITVEITHPATRTIGLAGYVAVVLE